jgi:hypothetical protein
LKGKKVISDLNVYNLVFEICCSFGNGMSCFAPRIVNFSEKITDKSSFVQTQGILGNVIEL